MGRRAPSLKHTERWRGADVLTHAAGQSMWPEQSEARSLHSSRNAWLRRRQLLLPRGQGHDARGANGVRLSFASRECTRSAEGAGSAKNGEWKGRARCSPGGTLDAIRRATTVEMTQRKAPTNNHPSLSRYFTERFKQRSTNEAIAQP